MLPADAGCVVDNVETAVAAYKAVVLGRPLMHKIITVTGDAIAEIGRASCRERVCLYV